MPGTDQWIYALISKLISQKFNPKVLYFFLKNFENITAFLVVLALAYGKKNVIKWARENGVDQKILNQVARITSFLKWRTRIKAWSEPA